MKNPSCDEGDRLGAILAEVFAGLAHGQAAGSDEVEGETADRGERAGAGANATAILVHRHVTNVMQELSAMSAFSAGWLSFTTNR